MPRRSAQGRRDWVSFPYHQEVAALSPAEQERWLDHAEETGMTAAELRAASRAIEPGNVLRENETESPEQDSSFDRHARHETASARRATIRNVAQLTAQQERALDLLAAGSRDSEVARELRVNRTTVWRWRHNDLEFQAQLNMRRHELWSASVERLRGLIPSALDALADELEGPRRLRAAATILDLAGFKAMTKSGIHLKPSGATTPEGIEVERRRDAELADLLAPLSFRA